jgi:hypothetical protein
LQPLIIGGIWQAAWLFVFAGVGTAKNPEENKTAGKVMIVSACLFIFSYASEQFARSMTMRASHFRLRFRYLGSGHLDPDW